ncbi:MAG: hypothetical protein R2770_08630 [Acidimicrobiales bacterium]
MHPIERLRYVARAGGVDQAMVVREAAGALGALGFDPAGLVTSCRRLVSRHPMAGALWVLASRVVTSADPMREAWAVVDELDRDHTARELAAALPDGAGVTIIGWPDTIPSGLVRRGDLRVLVVDQFGEASGLVRQLEDRDVDAEDVPMVGLGGAVRSTDIVLIEASMAGEEGVVASSGSLAAAATARATGARVWAVIAADRVLPPSTWRFATSSLRGPEPWGDDDEIVPLDMIDSIVGPVGLRDAAELRLRTDCVVAPELLRTPI